MGGCEDSFFSILPLIKKNMAKYRIKKVTRVDDGKFKYLVEKRFLGFLWWYDPFEDGLYTDGEYDTFEDAHKSVTILMTKNDKITEIVWEV